MKKLLKFIPVLIGILFASNSCIVVDDDPWEDDHYYYDPDEETCLYLREGRWYPASRSGLTECEFDSYMVFRGGHIYTYDCHDINYDSGVFDVHNNYLNIRYSNGDRMEYRIIRACGDELEIRSTYDGITYIYVRQF
ncbi:MAG: lipocalin family protein [Paludibacteraceae bacterium]|nr:lipocalin family protein [Paludibacteraceae bacterium]